jgi:hypothetical protein
MGGEMDTYDRHGIGIFVGSYHSRLLEEGGKQAGGMFRLDGDRSWGLFVG